MTHKKRLTWFYFLIAAVLAVLYAFPFALVIINSLKQNREITKDPMSLPNPPQFGNYPEAIDKMQFWQALMNSLLVTVLGVVAIVIVSSGLAYYLSREKTKLSTVIFLILVASMVVPFQSIMLSFVRQFGQNGLHFPFNQFSLVFFYTGFGLALSTFLYHGFMANIPRSLDEAAAIDGASAFRTYRTVIFPLLGPVTATVAVLNSLWMWNDYLLPRLILLDNDQRTIPLRTFNFFGQYSKDYGLAMAGLLVAMVPIIIFYFVMQKRIIAGISAGAVK